MYAAAYIAPETAALPVQMAAGSGCFGTVHAMTTPPSVPSPLPVSSGVEAGALLPDLDRLQAVLAAVEDPLARARTSTVLLAELERLRLGVADTRRGAVAETGMGPRGLARCLDISLGAAADLCRAAAGGSRRPTR